jgi:two-component system KDP operon response regulator KdpE
MTLQDGSMVALVIDDEIQIRRLLRLALESRGYEVREAESGQLGLQEAAFHRPDVVLLDLGLPDMDGSEVLKRLRGWSDVPVLVLSVRDQENVKVQAFERGADDYVTKPFGTAELMARLQAIQRRAISGHDSPLVECGPLKLDMNSHEATLAGAGLKLTPTEYALLKCLMVHAGRVVTHSQLLKDVWGPHASSHAHSLRVYINLLRRKLSGSAGKMPQIVNEPGIGYRLINGA